MKKGPANLDKDKAGAAAEIPANLKKSMDGLEKIRSEKENITAQIEALKEKLGAGAVDVKFQAAIEEVAKAMEDVPGHVGKMGDKLVSLDFERKIKTAKLSKETEGKISKLNARIDKARRVMKRLADTVEAIQAESFERLGGEETVKPRVAVFPKPGVKSAFAELSMLSVAIMSPAQRERLMRVEASLLSMFKSLVSSVKDFVKSLAGIDDLEEDLAESIKKDMADAPAAA
jgi:chaperonin cofactor prefoldin